MPSLARSGLQGFLQLPTLLSAERAAYRAVKLLSF